MVGEALLSIAVALGLAGGAVGCYFFAWYSWRRASHPIANRFAPVMLADGSWALFSLFGHLSPTRSIALFWRPAVVVVATFAASFWFLFVVEYTADSEWLPGWLTTAVLAQPLLFVPFAALNPGGLVFSSRGFDTFGYLALPYVEFGPVMALTSLYTFALLITSFVFLGRFLLRSRNLFRKQAALIFAVNAVVVLSTMAYVTGLRPHPNLDVTPIFFAVNAIGTGVALYRYDFLDVEPMAAHTLLAEMDDPVLVVKRDGKLADWNRAADDFVAASHGQATIDDIRELDLTDSLTTTDGGIPETIAPEQGTVDGQSRTYDVRTTTIDDRYGVVRGHAIVLRDVTEQEQRKRGLQTQNERLEEFTGVVSHDLRNPLQLIDGRLELARETGDLDHLDGASDAVERMERMLDELLTLAREGQTIDEPERVDIGACARDAWESVVTDTGSLVVETDRTVQSDRARLQRVFENLFRNSVEHSDGSVTVTVGSSPDGFHVADDGPGIPSEKRDTVFEFGTTFAEEGTGLGLAIVKRVVEAHGWTIAVTESESGGARFEVSLPDCDSSAAE